MARWTRMTDFWIDLPDQPGELARLAAKLREAEINLLGLWGYGAQNGHARFYCVPEHAQQFRDFAEQAELTTREGATFYLSASDRGNTLVNTLDQIAKAGINLLAIQAVSIRGSLGCFLWAEQKDWPALAELLG